MQNATFTDQMNRQVSISFPPQRIISLVPSQTELLFELGLATEVVGITKFCIHPADQFRSKSKVGGTKKVNVDLIRELKPDLIIGNKEENAQDQIEELMREFPVWMSDIKDLDDALEMILGIGEITGKEERACEIAGQIKENFANLSAENRKGEHSVLYLIWKDPFMVAGQGTFITDMLERAGWKNAVQSNRYPELSVADIQALTPDRIFLSSEPYPFKEKHIAEFQSICPDARVDIVDGEMFSWYGSRLLLVPAYLKTICNKRG